MNKFDLRQLHLATGLEGSAANVLVPETTGHLQGSHRVHALVGRHCLAGCGEPTTYLAGGHNVQSVKYSTQHHFYGAFVFF